eukprot:364100-Chlamydomonas_euryale.AAC.67
MGEAGPAGRSLQAVSASSDAAHHSRSSTRKGTRAVGGIGRDWGVPWERLWLAYALARGVCESQRQASGAARRCTAGCVSTQLRRTYGASRNDKLGNHGAYLNPKPILRSGGWHSLSQRRRRTRFIPCHYRHPATLSCLESAVGPAEMQGPRGACRADYTLAHVRSAGVEFDQG